MSKRGWYSSEVFFGSWFYVADCQDRRIYRDLPFCLGPNAMLKMLKGRLWNEGGNQSDQLGYWIWCWEMLILIGWHIFVIFHFFVFFSPFFVWMSKQAGRQASKQARDHQNTTTTTTTTITTTKTRNGKKIPKKIWTHFNSVNFVVDVCRNTVSLSLVFSRNMFRNWRLFGWQSHIPATSDCYACDAWP